MSAQVRTPDSHLQLQISLEEEQIKNELLMDRLQYHMSKNLDLELKIKVLDAKIDEFMKMDAKYRSMLSSKKISE